jgi:hypothetical protein
MYKFTLEFKCKFTRDYVMLCVKKCVNLRAIRVYFGYTFSQKVSKRCLTCAYCDADSSYACVYHLT